MSDYEEDEPRDDDDWYDDDDLRSAKEEPDCYACVDSGYVRAGRLSRLFGREWRRCPSCYPGRLDVLTDRWRTLTRRGRRGGPYSDSAPF